MPNVDTRFIRSTLDELGYERAPEQPDGVDWQGAWPDGQYVYQLIETSQWAGEPVFPRSEGICEVRVTVQDGTWAIVGRCTPYVEPFDGVRVVRASHDFSESSGDVQGSRLVVEERGDGLSMILLDALPEPAPGSTLDWTPQTPQRLAKREEGRFVRKGTVRTIGWFANGETVVAAVASQRSAVVGLPRSFGGPTRTQVDGAWLVRSDGVIVQARVERTARLYGSFASGPATFEVSLRLVEAPGGLTVPRIEPEPLSKIDRAYAPVHELLSMRGEPANPQEAEQQAERTLELLDRRRRRRQVAERVQRWLISEPGFKDGPPDVRVNSPYVDFAYPAWVDLKPTWIVFSVGEEGTAMRIENIRIGDESLLEL